MLDDQSNGRCCVVVLRDRRYLSRRCLILQTRHLRQHSQILDDREDWSVGQSVTRPDLHDASLEQFSRRHPVLNLY